jgi:DNA polymerase V
MDQLEIPLFSEKIKAGFPSPAEDFVEDRIDLNKYLIKNPISTFFVKVDGSSMENANIFKDDILVIDKSINPKNKDIVVAILNGEFTVKRLILKNENKSIYLAAENIDFKEIKITKEMDFEIFGVVTYIIHKAK